MRIAVLLATIMVASVSGRPGNDHCNKPADVVFVLDSSNSIWLPDFHTQLSFVKKVVKMFDVGPGPEQTRIGALTYGHAVWRQFDLKDKTNKQELIDAIGHIEHGRGRTTNTFDAIKFAIKKMFTPEAGNRPDVTRVVVVITDGRSQKPDQTRAAAAMAHAAGVNVFAIGVGDEIDDRELSDIASDPDEDFKFNVNDYKALDSITERLATQTCTVTVPPSVVTTTTTPVPTTTTTKATTTTEIKLPADSATENCGGKPADVYFIIDASGSIYKSDFDKEIQFVKDMVNLFDIGADRTRVGAMTFSDRANPLLGLNNKLSKPELIRRIGDAEHSGGGTNTADALRIMRLHGFNKAFEREDAAKIAVVLTDGLSANEGLTQREAKLAQAAGINVFSIGIGGGVDLIELKAIASEPSANYVFQVDDFSSLDAIKEILAIKTCQVKPDDLTKEPKDGPVCSAKQPTDMMFVYDSASIGAWRSKVISDFIASVVTSVDMSPGFLRVGRATDNCPSGGNFDLSDKLSGADFSEIQFATFSHLLKKVKRTAFSEEYGAQEDSSKIAVIFVDSEMESLDRKALNEIGDLKGQNVNTYLIAIGYNPVISKAARLVGGNRVINVESYETLKNAHMELINKLCLFFDIDALDYEIDYVVPV